MTKTPYPFKDEASKTVAAPGLRHLIAAGPDTCHTILTDRGIQFTNRTRDPYAFRHTLGRNIPLHPYTKALISAALPIRPGEEREELPLSGEVTSPTNPPSGCRFHPRCPLALARCSQEIPELHELAPGHQAACHLY